MTPKVHDSLSFSIFSRPAMRFTLFLLAFAQGMGVAVANVGRPAGRCGTAGPNAQSLAMTRMLSEEESQARVADPGNKTVAPSINVRLYVHVVASSTKPADGWLSVGPPYRPPVDMYPPYLLPPRTT